ncbi:LysR family transcriptional regulator [Allonocardiopsis opalescens]|uniref:LysR family transcriptional regulator n=1 Tax=Allonocardiopsis opalescens TaxID=1144618 RepID=A0A2T0PWF0_9ACTN|nr:LysR family transcriptional regulator [Allonocardiopsis opalescens]PRX95688.1 LysR family transcriptional regulator [Allonocardiopsis opalescens]
MEIRQLEYFVAVAEERHFTRAAQRMLVAQSGLSASIRSLERELGAALFIRSTRRVELTDAGRALLTEARHALAKVAAARDAVAAVQGLLRGSLAVGSLQCLGAIDVPGLLAEFHGRHPQVELRLWQDGSAELAEAVRTGALDVAFVCARPDLPPDLDAAPLAVEPLVLACAPSHPLAGRAAVGLAELRGESFVDFNATWGTRETVDRALAEAGVPRRVTLAVNDVHSLLDLVAHGLGIAIVPRHFSAKTTRARFVPLRDAPSWETVAVTAAGGAGGAAARTLLEMATKQAAG